MAQKITDALVWAALPQRTPDSHKGSYGRALLVCGSARYRGAAALAAEGAARVGAGIVTLASVEPVIGSVTPRLPECCFLPCRAGDEGGISASEANRLIAAARGCTAVLFGPGLGNTADTRALLELVIPAVHCTVVLDADGLNAAATLGTLPRPAGEAALIVTPHLGEMARLSGLSVDDLKASSESIAAGYARSSNCVLVLKSHKTLVAGPGGQLLQNTAGNAGLARGGSGDVLAGMIAGLAAQGLAPYDAAAAAVWLHSTAADHTAKRLGQYGMLPHDLFYDLGQLFAEHER